MTLEKNDILDSDVLSLDRRTTLQGLAGALGTSIVGGGAATAQQSPESRSAPSLDPDENWDQHFDTAIDNRRTTDAELISDVAERNSPYEQNRDADFVVRVPGSQDQQSYRPFAYSKALGYDSELGISTDRHAEFIQALSNGESEFPLGEGDRPLVSPQALSSHATEGTDPWLGAMPPAYPAYDSGDDVRQLYTYAETLDVLAATYYRHNSFASISEDPISGLSNAIFQDGARITPALAEAGVNEDLFAWVAGPTLPSRVFRDAFYGCQTGPYVTQHLAHEIPLSGGMATTIEPLVDPITSDPYGTTFEELQPIRGGQTPGAEAGHASYDVSDGSFGPELAGEPQYIHRGQDLATYVRADPSYTSYLYAALQLANWGTPLGDDIPNSSDDTDVLAYIDSGGVAIVDQLGRVARNALQSAWHHKWGVHRRIRPESYVERIIAARNGAGNNGPPASTPPISNVLDYWTDSSTLDVIQDRGFGDGLLPLAYPEGSPAHPSYPSGHSVIAGACATVLKTFFENVSYDDLDVNPRYNTDGTESGFESTSAELDVHGEINKYASNIGMGRIFAGVHFRTDHVYGMLLGEQIAVATLYDHYVNNIDNGSGELTFTTLIGGEERTISPETFSDLRQAALDREGLRP